jgi:hypothetical protein
MSQQNPIRLYVTHLWSDSDDYLRVFEYLESARNFFYKNLSRPDARPSADKEAQKEALREQIRNAEAVIALASLYGQDRDLVTFQLLFAKANDKPVLLLPGFGSQQPAPPALAELADVRLEWDERALIDAIRREARHEESTRWDVVEFKLD